MILKDCKRLAEVDFLIAEVSPHAARDLRAAPQDGHRPTGLPRNWVLRGGHVLGTHGRDRASRGGALSRLVSPEIAGGTATGSRNEKSRALPHGVSGAVSGLRLAGAHHPRQAAKPAAEISADK